MWSSMVAHMYIYLMSNVLYIDSYLLQCLVQSDLCNLESIGCALNGTQIVLDDHNHFLPHKTEDTANSLKLLVWYQCLSRASLLISGWHGSFSGNEQSFDTCETDGIPKTTLLLGKRGVRCSEMLKFRMRF